MSGDALKILKLETSSLIENFPCNYIPDHLMEKEDKLRQESRRKDDIKFVNPSTYEILDYSGIPSSISILQADSVPQQDMREFREKRKQVNLKKWGKEFSEEIKDVLPELLDPEVHLKQLIMGFTPKDEIDHTKKATDDAEAASKKKVESAGSAILDFEEGLYFGDSQYGNMIRYYLTLEKILTVEWFINKLQFPPDEVINMEHAIECGLPFWKEDEFDARIKNQIKTSVPESAQNLRSKQFFFDQVVSLRSKRNIAEVVNCFGLTIKNFVG